MLRRRAEPPASLDRELDLTPVPQWPRIPNYIRGHRLALIWLGASLDALRRIRS